LHRYRDGYRFAKLACDLVEKHGFIGDRAKVYHATGLVAFWTQPIAIAIDLMCASLLIATDTGELAYACYSALHIVLGLLVGNEHLDAVWRESEV
jgi:hypothetical protein